MEITYIGHSGFLLEWETCYWLFDYYKGDIPELNTGKKLIVFASHKHADHFNPEVLKLQEQYHDILYVLSSDIKLKSDISTGTGMATDKLISVKPNQEYDLYVSSNDKIILKTLKSTDSGVAFLLTYLGKTIYHAGDLNLWLWKEESKQYNNNMKAMFEKQMEYLKDLSIDIAFAPLDPRQEEWSYMGLEYLFSTAKVRYAFPMHFWDQPEIIQHFKRDRSSITNSVNIMDISREGQNFTLDI